MPGALALFSSSESKRHQPPSSLVGGRFLSLLVVQLIVAGLGFGMSRYVYTVCREVTSLHERLTETRQQIDEVSGRLSSLFPIALTSPAQRPEFDHLTRELDQSSLPFLLQTSRDLPNESAEVADAITALHITWRVSREAGDDEQLRDATNLALATARLERALFALSMEVSRLDEVNISRVKAARNFRIWSVVWQALACLLTLLSFGYAAQLYRQLRREELARFAIQSELAAERVALEERVQARTAALEEEVTERQRVENLNRSRNHVLEMVARNEPIAEIFKVLARMVAEIRRNAVCTIHSLGSGTFDMVASSGLNERLQHNLQLISADFSGAAENAAMVAGVPTMIEDLAAERKPWSELLCANGLVSVWSAPFFAPDAGALGTLTIYTRLKWKPTPADMEMLEMACHMASLVLERSRLQAQLIDHAYHDSLTGTPNRRLGQDRLANAIKRSARNVTRFAVLWIDLDKFKQINDQYGHPVGDAVLQQASRRLATRLRASDTLARMGGDEFMAIIEGTSTPEEAETLARDLLDVLACPMQVGELELFVTASIGISLYPEDGKTVNTLAQHADQAMYVAKFGSCGLRSFSPEMDREPAERRELEAELSQALETGGFSLAYQPLCLPSGSLVGFEALLRFESPRLGNVPPSQFIPIAEQTQLIVPLGEWVLREACLQNRAWQEAGHSSVSIAVNISALQFAQEDFADTVAQILAETGQPGAKLVLELTESIVMRDFAESARQMKRLKKLGVRIAIDDFGTGYSSLSYLHRLPIDVLKIDRSFMENLNEPDGTGPIVEAVVSMAHTLSLRVVAEGVETAEQLASLDNRGCDVIQGYYFSRPVDAVTATEFLRRGKVEGGVDELIPAPPALLREGRVSMALA
jgi:diguanylate cyclase (GGDEF)-like protein